MFSMKRFPARAIALWSILVAGCLCLRPASLAAEPRWNILFVFADDWGRYASCYQGLDGRPTINDVIRTPHVDRVARQGVLFRNAFVNAPVCTPSRSALLSGRYFFNCGQGAITDGAAWDASIPSFPLLLREAGYTIGKSHKVWSPGTPRDAPFGGAQYAFERRGNSSARFSGNALRMVAAGESVAAAREKILAEVRGNFDDFLASRRQDEPWHYFFGPTTTHRAWIKGSGRRLWNIDPDALKGRLPAFLPDVPEVREDVADYLGECQAIDAYVGALLQRIEETGQADRTLIVLSGDHGMPGVPSGKGNLYDHGVRVPLVIQVPGGKAGRIVDDMVSLADLAPTFMEVGGVTPPSGLYGRSLLPLLRSDKSGVIDPTRDWVITGRERHVAIAREGNLPNPMRSLRTPDYVYIRNFTPERWPMGSPGAITPTTAPSAAVLESNVYIGYADMDVGPTKAWLIGQRHDPAGKRFFDFAFGRRPAEELYDVRQDPDQMKNLAGDPAFAGVKTQLAERLLRTLTEAGDPRVTGDGKTFERPPFIGDEFQTRHGIDQARRDAAKGGRP